MGITVSGSSEKEKKDQGRNPAGNRDSKHSKGKEIEAFIKTIDELKMVIKDKDNQVLRIRADFDNLKKRSEKRIEEMKLNANRDLIVEMLDVIDDFEMALASAGNTKDAENLKEGFSQIYKIFMGILESYGLEPIKCVDTKFDPNRHEAVVTFESIDHEHDMITDEIRKGYVLNDAVIRFPRVRIAKNPDKDLDKGKDCNKDTEMLND